MSYQIENDEARSRHQIDSFERAVRSLSTWLRLRSGDPVPWDPEKDGKFEYILRVALSLAIAHDRFKIVHYLFEEGNLQLCKFHKPS